MLLFCSKADFHSANLTSQVIFFNEIVRVTTSKNVCETFLIKHEISYGPKCSSQIWKSAVIGRRFFSLKSADIHGVGTFNEPLRTSAWEASRLKL